MADGPWRMSKVQAHGSSRKIAHLEVPFRFTSQGKAKYYNTFHTSKSARFGFFRDDPQQTIKSQGKYSQYAESMHEA
jgi:hypothetical protein